MENRNIAAASPEEGRSRPAFGWAARDTTGVLSPFTFTRRKNGEKDLTIKILYCGVCHTDLHSVKGERQNAVYPIVPGHEIVGVVTEVGGEVGRFKVGDHAGVGCMVNSCRSCHECAQHRENYCPGMIRTYNSTDTDGTVTYGGYADSVVVEEHFAVRFPAGMPLDRGAPLLCAGITVYSAMKRFGFDVPGKHIGVVGLGGLGHVAVKFGKAFGAKVTVISTSPSKKQEAVERLGADAFLVSKDADQMKAARGTMDGIINTVSAVHKVTPLLSLLKTFGQMVMVGAPMKPLEVYASPLLLGGKSIVGSIIGGMKETQEMIDFAAEHSVAADIELIGMDYVNEAMERLAKADVRYRFVIDIGNTLRAT